MSFSSFGFFRLFARMSLLWFYWLNCIGSLDLQAGRNERIILGQDTFWVLLSLHCGYSHHDAFSYAHTLSVCISCANTNVLKPWHVLSTWSSHNWNPVFCIDLLLWAKLLFVKERDIYIGPIRQLLLWFLVLTPSSWK